MVKYKKRTYEELKFIDELATLIHNTAIGQGWGCYHPGAGLHCCEGMAIEIIKFFEKFGFKVTREP